MLKRHLFACMCALVVFSQVPLAHADGSELSRCLVDSTTGKDRKDLARWVFSAMALHPEMLQFSNISPKQRENLSETAGKLYSRLLFKDCKTQFVALVKNNNRDAVMSAFEILGRMAMQELMSDPDVTKSVSSMVNYLDMDALKKLE